MKTQMHYAGLIERSTALLVDLVIFCAFFFPVTRLGRELIFKYP
jgi:hypothetical protein